MDEFSRCNSVDRYLREVGIYEEGNEKYGEGMHVYIGILQFPDYIIDCGSLAPLLISTYNLLARRSSTRACDLVIFNDQLERRDLRAKLQMVRVSYEMLSSFLS